MLNIEKIKKLFPILNRKINGKPLVYLDNASTTQKPKQVIEKLKNYYETLNANTHRGIHTLSEKSTIEYENCRKKIAKFINAKSEKEIIFTRNTTESINLVAYTWGEKNIKENDEIIISILEHHSNFVPWQVLAKKKKAKLKIIPIKKDFKLDMEKYKSMLSKKTRLVCITAMSNVTGTIPDLQKIIKEAHKVNAIVLVDGAQSIVHQETDVKKLDCDFFAFSSHKMFGPTGVGILHGKEKILKNIPPFLYGGDMIKEVHKNSCNFNELPWKFEAGTPNIADTIALSSAIDFIEDIGFKNIKKHENELLTYAKNKFSKYKKVKLLSPKNTKETGPVLSFTIEGVHPHDIASIFDSEGIAIRSGQHCAQPLMEDLKISSTARISFSIYNTKNDIDKAENALKKVLKIFK